MKFQNFAAPKHELFRDSATRIKPVEGTSSTTEPVPLRDSKFLIRGRDLEAMAGSAKTCRIATISSTFETRRRYFQGVLIG